MADGKLLRRFLAVVPSLRSGMENIMMKNGWNHVIFGYIANRLDQSRKREVYRQEIQHITDILLGWGNKASPKKGRIRADIYRIFFPIGKKCWIGYHVEMKKRHSDLYLHNRNNDITIGDHVRIRHDASLDYTGGLTIKRDTIISAHTLILTHSHRVDNEWTRMPVHPTRYNHLTIEQGVWLGERSMILPEVSRIGKYCVVGAGAVVGKNIPDYAIVSGNPARIIGYVRH